MNQDMMEALQALAVERGISVDALFGALAFRVGSDGQQGKKGEQEEFGEGLHGCDRAVG